MKRLLLLISFFCSQTILFSQVGINTETPQALLDIKSSSETTPLPTDGVLLPKMDEFPTTDPGNNQDGMLVYITGNGSETKGYYYWNNDSTSWEAIHTGSGVGDTDWFATTTTDAPSNTQSMFRIGRIAVGQDNFDFPAQFSSFSWGSVPSGQFQQETGNGDNSANILTRNILTGNGGVIRGQLNLFSATNPSSTSVRGIENNIEIEGSGPKTGIINYIAPSNSNSGVRKGIRNIIGFANTSTVPIGVENEVYGNLSAIGTRNWMFNTNASSNFAEVIGTENRLSASNTTFQKGTKNIFSTSTLGLKIGVDNNYNANGIGEHVGLNNNFNSTSAARATGVVSNFQGSGTDTKTGMQNNFDAIANGTNVGMENIFSSNNAAIQIGIANDFEGNGDGQKTGVSNSFINIMDGDIVGSQSIFNGTNDAQATGSSHSFIGAANQTIYGTRNYMNTSGTGTVYGSQTLINSSSSGFKWGNYVRIDPSAGGFHIGMYSEALKPGALAGMFRGGVAIGTSLATQYRLPFDRGTANQILQTNAAGVVSWVDNPSVSPWQRSGTEVSLANTGDDVVINNQQTSINFPPASSNPPAMINLFASGTNNADRMIFSQSPAYQSYGLMYRDFDDSFRFLRAGIDRVVINVGSVTTPLVVNGTAQASNFQSATTTYPDYVFEAYYTGDSQINPDYQFLNLEETAHYIETNGHLPGVLSYEDVKANNMQFSLTETSIKNLEKIEELYLHLIEIKEENTKLKEQNKILFQQQKVMMELITKLESQIKN